MADEKTVPQKLAEFFEACMQAAWEGRDMEGGELQDMAKEMGLLKSEPFDCEKHEAAEALFDPEPGDEWFTLVPEVHALLSEAQIHNVPK